MNLLIDISHFLSVPTSELEVIVNKAQDSYKRYFIKKKNGEKRAIFHPSSSLKAIQYSLINLYFNKLPTHEIAYGYIKGLKSPLRKNGELHANFNYSVRIDFKDFFPSITKDDVFYYLEKNNILFNKEDKKKLEKIIFPKLYISKGLPIGSPSSPIISNVVMFELDKKIEHMSKKITTDSAISRYVDDIIFSSNKYEYCVQFVKNVYDLLDKTKHPKLSVNSDKTLFMSTKGKRTITGLIVTPEKKVSIGRKNKRYIKKLIFDHTHNNLDDQLTNHLIGYLAFILDVEPEFYNSLVMKYGNVVNEIMRT